MSKKDAVPSPLSPNNVGSPKSPSRARAAGTSSGPAVAEGFGGPLNKSEMDQFLSGFDEQCMREQRASAAATAAPEYHQTTRFHFLDVAPFARNAAEGILQDSFTQCFESKPRDRWNFTWYLMPLYWSGVALRYFVLLPIRMVALVGGLLFASTIILLAAPLPAARRHSINAMCVRIMAQTFLLTWCAVVREHGATPPREAGQIYVANHSSVIDVGILLRRQNYSLTGQAHPGLLGFFQTHLLASMDNLWFDRLESKDRQVMARRIRAHAADTSKPPLLVFPEGTCVNNEYVVMFKRGAFELGTCIVPVAIKYNKIFVDAYWNSRKQSFAQHLFSLMTSWAVVCDVYYMDPQYRREGETSTEFAGRVKEMIAKQARLISVPWDGYLKYFKPRPAYKERRKEQYTKLLVSRFAELPEFSNNNTTLAEKEEALDTLDTTAAVPVVKPGQDGVKKRRPRTHSMP